METNWISVLLAGTFIGFSVLAESKEMTSASMKPNELNTCLVEASASGNGLMEDLKACESKTDLRK